jgi:transcriptional regulator with XRE-family HTH domain
MSLFSDNIRSLRIRRGISQEKLAESLYITRGRYVKYEDGTSEPPFDILRRISLFWHVSIDLLLSVDIRKVAMDELLRLEDNRILLPIKVDHRGGNMIEIIPHKARAGYLTGYSDPEFIENLPQITLPMLGPGKHRAFPISGDSMPPHGDSSFIVGRYVENLGEIRLGKTYILVTQDEGIVYKRLEAKHAASITVSSDNIVYAPYDIRLSDICEIWEFAYSLNAKEADPDDHTNMNVKDVLLGLKEELRHLRKGQA